MIHAKAKLSIYAPRGSYQLLIYQVMDAGKGLLEKAFELKENYPKRVCFPSAKNLYHVTPKQSVWLPRKPQPHYKSLGAERRYPIAAIEVMTVKFKVNLRPILFARH